MLRIMVEGAPQGSADSGFDFGNPDVSLDDLFALAEQRERKALVWSTTEKGNLSAKIDRHSRYIIFATSQESNKDIAFFIASHR
jgi:hypothetical protein